MSVPTCPPLPPIAGLIDAALAGGRAVMAVYGRADFGVHLKADDSPVTEADAAAEAAILTRLRRLAPDLAVVAEEATAARGAPADIGAVFALVDPLDGTKEFIARNGEFTVNIGIVRDGRPVVGVVLAPALGRIWWGVVGTGAFAADLAADDGDAAGLLAAATAIAVRAAPPAGLSVMASRSHCGAATEAFLARLPVAERMAAGSSLKFCRIAEGCCDLYPRHGPTMEWDTAAGDAVLTAAGGHVVDLDGRPLRYGKCAEAFHNPAFVAMGALAPERICR
jgi:3'(2'),5'-bisphosphate nucleotidase